jgi:F-type H+-transporting ATPase subunit epsilon
MATLHLDIVTQEKRLFSGDVDMVVAPGGEGELGILPHHAPLLTTLSYGVLRVRQGSQEHAFTIAGGVMEVRPDRVTVLADTGESIDEIDEARAEAARERAQRMLAEGPVVSDAQLREAEAALQRSKLRLDAVRRYRRARRPGAGEGGSRDPHAG